MCSLRRGVIRQQSDPLRGALTSGEDAAPLVHQRDLSGRAAKAQKAQAKPVPKGLPEGGAVGAGVTCGFMRVGDDNLPCGLVKSAT